MRFHEWLHYIFTGGRGASNKMPPTFKLPESVTPSARIRHRISHAGMEAIIQHEGLRLNAYQDTKGIWTIGVGHTAAAGGIKPFPGLTITHEEAMRQFDEDLDIFEDAVNESVLIQINQQMFDALVSICFNIGPGAFRTSTIVRCLNAGAISGAADSITMWNKPKEIRGRRYKEYVAFCKGARLSPKPRENTQCSI